MSFGSPGSLWRSLADPADLFHGPGSGGKNFLGNSLNPLRPFTPPPPSSGNNTATNPPISSSPTAAQSAAAAAAGGGITNPLIAGKKIVDDESQLIGTAPTKTVTGT